MKIRIKNNKETAFEDGVMVNVRVESKYSDKLATAKIVSHEEVTFISVDWLDGTYSDDMLIEDIMVI